MTEAQTKHNQDMALPNIAESPAPTRLAYKGGMTMSKKERRELNRIFSPLIRPARIPATRRAKWRLVKKWFNRYEKQTLIGRTVIVATKGGKQIATRITNVKIEKAGGYRRNYLFTSRP